jgi:glycosyltransferase involved in cell wall biosynthesis
MKDGAAPLTHEPGPRRLFSAFAGGPYTGVASMKPLLYSVLPRPAHPTRDGLSIRNYHLLAALAEDFRVRAAALLPLDLRGTGEYPAGVEVEEVPQAGRTLRRAAALAASALSGEAYPALLYRSRALSSRIARWTARERPAWIVAHSYHVAPAVFACGARAWVDFHNVDSEIWRRMGESAASALARAAARWQAPRVERLERRILQEASGASCVSERDAGALAALGGASPLVVSNGVDLGRYAFRAEPAAEEIVFFVGDLTWPPNAEGVAWFCAEVWPLLARLRPSVRTEILGRGLSSGAARRSPPGVSFLGEGEDTRPHWSRASVAIVPLLAGGGTRLKILEAAACGVPVVSTPLGAEGLDFTEGEEILLAAGAEEFAGAVARLLADADARRSQAAAARRRVERQYGWSEIGRRFARELAALA